MKHYTDRDAAALIDEVEAQGGAYLPETCGADELEYTLPSGEVRHTLSSGCEEDALFLVAYDPGAKVAVDEPVLVPDPSPDAPSGRTKQKRDANDELEYARIVREGVPSDTLSTVRVCANDDLLRSWPRFRHVITSPDPTTGGAR